jgi:hypothetical protein
MTEHDEIAKNKADGEALTWEDLHKMRFTWRVALEDVKFDGHLIPKGWQVFWVSRDAHGPRIFPNPYKFDLSRFESQPPPYSFVKFGGAGRGCAPESSSRGWRRWSRCTTW